MVTKLSNYYFLIWYCLILAKNHMVTKHTSIKEDGYTRLILAKNHMVTKLIDWEIQYKLSLILAKNHMVTKRV